MGLRSGVVWKVSAAKAEFLQGWVVLVCVSWKILGEGVQELKISHCLD